MKKDLKSFKSGKTGANGNVPEGVPKDVAESFERGRKKYEGKSETELMDELLTRRSEIDMGQLERFEKSAGAMLTAEQRRKLKSIVDSLRR